MNHLSDKRILVFSIFFPVFVGAVLRISNLAGPDLWFDEVIYLQNSSGSFDELVMLTQDRNSSPFLLPFVLYLLDWDVVPWTSRIPSVLGGVALLAVVAGAVRSGVLTRKPGILALWVLALNPFLIRYSQEVREYSIGALFAFLVAVLGWLVLRHSGGARVAKSTQLLFLATLVITPHVSYGAIFVGLAVICLLLLQSIMGGRWGFSLLTAVLFSISLALAWIQFASFQSGITKADYLLPFYPDSSSPAGFAGSLFRAVGGVLSQSLGNPLLAVFALCASLYLVYLVARRGRFSWRMPKTINWTFEAYWIALGSTLLLGILVAWWIGIYPMGAIRQQVPLAPVFSITGVVLVSLWLEDLARARAARTFVVLAIFANAFLYPWVYSERNAVTEPLNYLVSQAPGAGVIYATEPLLTAGKFYFPEVTFSSMEPGSGPIQQILLSKTAQVYYFLLSGNSQLDAAVRVIESMTCSDSELLTYPGMTTSYLIEIRCD